MCGIAGIVAECGFQTNALIKLSKIQRHRGPDDEGFVVIGNNNQPTFLRGEDTIKELSCLPHIKSIGPEMITKIGLVHRRLSIIDLNYTGHQPFVCNKGKHIISYNGEIYNFKEIRKELRADGYEFISTSDTEVILYSYKKWGDECVHKFIGMWAFVIMDLEKNVLFLSRDRFGIKPLYYIIKPGRFAFASEVKALLELDICDHKVNEKDIYQFLVYGKLNDPNRTLFEDVVELPAGYNLIFDFDNYTYQKSQYYDLAENVLKKNSESNKNSLDASYKELFINSMDLHLRSDVPVGACLSGGLDSSTIVAFSSSELDKSKFNTFTAAYRDEKIDESNFAKLMSKNFENIRSFYTYPSSTKLWQDYDKLTWHQDLPFGSTSIFAQWEVMKLASDHGMKVLLDGQGADESLGGYAIYAGIYLLNQLKRFRLFSFLKDFKSLERNRSIKAKNEIGRALYYLLPDILKGKVYRRKSLGSKFISPELRAEFESEVYSERVSKKLDYRETCILAIRYGLHDLLRYEDRNSMAFSIESRVPFLDHRIVEYSLSLPVEWKMNQGWSKYILRKIGEPLLPSEIVWRKDKKGFITPQHIWKEELKNEIINYIKEYKFPKILDKNYVILSYDDHYKNSSQLTQFWRLISFLKWLDNYKIKI